MATFISYVYRDLENSIVFRWNVKIFKWANIGSQNWYKKKDFVSNYAVIGRLFAKVVGCICAFPYAILSILALSHQI